MIYDKYEQAAIRNIFECEYAWFCPSIFFNTWNIILKQKVHFDGDVFVPEKPFDTKDMKNITSFKLSNNSYYCFNIQLMNDSDTLPMNIFLATKE